jgi:hypothetical protein
MDTTEQLKCADKIAQELFLREEDLLDYYRIIDSDDVLEADRDRAREAIQEMAYGISKRTVYSVVWSGGGPADYLDLTLNSEGELLSVEYIYKDWFDGAKVFVSEDSPAYRYALELIEILNA